MGDSVVTNDSRAEPGHSAIACRIDSQRGKHRAKFVAQVAAAAAAQRTVPVVKKAAQPCDAARADSATAKQPFLDALDQVGCVPHCRRVHAR